MGLKINIFVQDVGIVYEIGNSYVLFGGTT